MKSLAGKSRVSTILIALVLFAWAGVIVAYLVHTKSSKSPVLATDWEVPAGEGDSIQSWDKERWDGIYTGQTKIGYAVSRLRREGDEYFSFNKLRIRLQLMNQTQEIKLNMQARMDDRFNLKEYVFESASPSLPLKSWGKMEGNDLLMVMESGGERVEHRLHFDEPVSLAGEWELEARLAGAKPGDEFRLASFEPMMSAEILVTVKVLGEETVSLGGEKIPAIKAEVVLDNHSTWVWVSKADGRIVKNYDPITGFTTLLEGREKAIDVDWDKAESVDLLLSFMVPSASIMNPRDVSFLKARLENIEFEGLSLEAPGRQSFADGAVTVQMEQAIPAAGYRLPIRLSLPDRAGELSEFLAPGPYIQSDHDKIKKAAEKARGGAEDAVAAVDALLAWVSEEVRDSYVFSIPSALEVLDKKKGACKEHTILFLALARASGIPARGVSGIVYSDENLVDGFYYHAWAEVWLAGDDGVGQWIAVDPTFDQNPADATHIKLTGGEFKDMVGLMNVIGRLKVDVEDYR